jgi:hypothetical protein
MSTDGDRPKKRRVRPTYKETESRVKKAVEETELALELARQEKITLEARTAALENVIDYITALSEVLSRQTLTSSLIPSSRLAPDPVQTFAHLSMESAWRGEEPRKEWLESWSSMTPAVVSRFNADFFNRLESSVEFWKVCSNESTKETVEKTIKMAIKVRSDIVHTMTTKNPKLAYTTRALMEASLPKQSQDDGGPSEILKRILRELHFTGEQRATIREAWGKYCHSRDLVYARVAQLLSSQPRRISVVISEVGGGEEEQQEVVLNLEPEQTRADDALNTLKVTQELKDCDVRMILAHSRLAVDIVDCITWQQFSTTNLSLRPYINDISQWCAIFSEIYLK